MCSVDVGTKEARVVTQVRDVEYVRPGSWSDEGPKVSKGWEIVKEERLCPDCVKKLGTSFVPQTVAKVSREVHETIPKKQKRRMMERRHNIDYADGSERYERPERQERKQ